jgi:hypothetical protein
MNLYFLSLLKEDRERRKNITCQYYLGSGFKFGGWIPKENIDETNSYLTTRFPFLKKGDLIIDGQNTVWDWDGNTIIHADVTPENDHPYFYDNLNWERENSTFFVNFPKTTFEKRISQNVPLLYTSRFKIGKVRYELILFLDNRLFRSHQEQFSLLESMIKRNFKLFIFKTNPDFGYVTEDYMSRYKKRLFLRYE